MIAALITHHHGEYIFRLGAQPSRAKLFSEVTDTPDGWTGIPRTEKELDVLQHAITTTVEELGGKVMGTIFEGD